MSIFLFLPLFWTKPSVNTHQAQNSCLCCLGFDLFGRAAAAATAVINPHHQSRHHHTSRCNHRRHHHPQAPQADFSILHLLPPSAEVITIVSCTHPLCPDHSSLPGPDRHRNFHRLRLAAQIVVLAAHIVVLEFYLLLVTKIRLFYSSHLPLPLL